jgi:Tol biopolymer transport system component
VWSPDGTLLAFDSDEADPDRKDDNAINDIYAIKPDGSGRTRITGGNAMSSDAAWSPDGQQLALASDQYTHPAKQAIYVMKPDGSAARKVTNPPAWAANDLAPRFSPDGSRLVFTRYRGEKAAEKAALFTVKLDGTGLRRLTTFRIHAGDADWSPDGRRLIFEAYPTKTSRGEVFTVRPDGSHLRNLTHNGNSGGSSDPVWSPDGRRILWQRAHVFGRELRIGLAVMKPDGSSKHYFEAKPQESHQPDWESR